MNTMKTTNQHWELDRVIDAVVRSVPLNTLDLSDEFYPAHLPVAVMDAVFRSRGRYGSSSASATERYCRTFGLSCTRKDRWSVPPDHEQETLGDLIRRHDELGLDRMTNEVFELQRGLAQQQTSSVECVLHIARTLQSIGVNVLQDMSIRRFNQISHTLQCVPGIGRNTIRRLMMYTGGDDFVLGDAHIRRFVANAVGRTSVSSHVAEMLVRNSAYELILSPRFLDRGIWQHCRSH